MPKRRTQTSLIILIVIVTLLVIGAIFIVLSLLQASPTITNTTITNTVITQPVDNRLVIAHVNVPVVVDDFNSTVLLTKTVVQDHVVQEVSVTIDDTVIVFHAVNETQITSNYQVRLLSATSASAQFVISKISQGL